MQVRFDVFSLKGGVGKTSVAVMLAKAIASDTKSDTNMVLLIDADLTGSCMGDLLERELGWSSAPDLTGLITGEPELLAESLYATKLPVYAWMRSHDPGCMGHYSTKWMNRRWQEKSRYSGVAAQLSGVLFCPSACVHGEGIRSHRVINALLAHESAGGWIQTVIDEVIDATNQCLKKAGNVELAAVIVDHGPGFGALQCASLDRIDTPPVPESKDAWLRRGIIVGSPDHVDLQSLQMFEATRGQWRGASRFTWLIIERMNRTTRSPSTIGIAVELRSSTTSNGPGPSVRLALARQCHRPRIRPRFAASLIGPRQLRWREAPDAIRQQVVQE